MRTWVCLLVVGVLGLGATAGPAQAQTLGLGPRFSFVHDLPGANPATRFKGGAIRLRTSKHIALEGSMDYRTEMTTDKTTRVREEPLQGSLLLFPVRAAFSPYLLGGYGLYTQVTQTLDLTTSKAVTTTTAKRTGFHLGLGAELFLSKHAAFFADYRYRFVEYGDPEAGSEALNIPGKSLIPVLGRLKLSHTGSMWTSGMAFYF